MALGAAGPLSRAVRAMSRTDYASAPVAPAGLNGTALRAGPLARTVVLVVLDGASEADLRAFPSLVRAWHASRFVPHRTRGATARSVVTALLLGCDLSRFMYHPVDRLLDSGPFFASAARSATWLSRIAAAGGTEVHVYGHRFLQEILSGAAGRFASSEFGDADAGESVARLGRVCASIAVRQTRSFDLVEIAMPRGAGARDRSRGGLLDRLDDGLVRLLSVVGQRGPVIVAGTVPGSRRAPGGEADIPVVFTAGRVVAGEGEPRPLPDLAATICSALGSPRPALSLGVPDPAVLGPVAPGDDPFALALAVARDRALTAAHLARALHRADLPVDDAALARAAQAFLAGRSDAGMAELVRLTAGIDGRLAALAAAAEARTGRLVEPGAALAAAGAAYGLAVLVGLAAAPSAALPALALATVATPPAAVALAAVPGPVQWPGLALLASEPFELAALPPVVIATLAMDLAWPSAAACAMLAVCLARQRRGGRPSAAHGLVSIALVVLGACGLYATWTVAYHGVVPGHYVPGAFRLHAFLVSGAVLVIGPVVIAPFVVLAAVWDAWVRWRGAAWRADPGATGS
jgi:hypothetical protein